MLTHRQEQVEGVRAPLCLLDQREPRGACLQWAEHSQCTCRQVHRPHHDSRTPFHHGSHLLYLDNLIQQAATVLPRTEGAEDQGKEVCTVFRLGTDLRQFHYNIQRVLLPSSLPVIGQ